MIGILIVCHGNLAQEFLTVCEDIMGPQPNCLALRVEGSEDIDKTREKLVSALKELQKSTQTVLVLTDMFGGTPSNLAISLLEEGQIEVLAGLNLPMLLKIFALRDRKSIAEVMLEAQESGRKYITVPSEFLRNAS